MSTVEFVVSLPDSVEEAVSFGVMLLDERGPGWANSIDLSTFSISNGDHCILGQLFGSYGYGCDRLGLHDEMAERFGFKVPGQKPWAPIQAEWTRVITERQGCGR